MVTEWLCQSKGGSEETKGEYVGIVFLWTDAMTQVKGKELSVSA